MHANVDTGRHLGFIAQEVQDIFPELVYGWVDAGANKKWCVLENIHDLQVKQQPRVSWVLWSSTSSGNNDKQFRLEPP